MAYPPHKNFANHINPDPAALPQADMTNTFFSAETLAILERQCQRSPPQSPYVFPSPLTPFKPMAPKAWYWNIFRSACACPQP
ncbi:MAG: hypothetical protein GKS05_09395 [Nitrospirales bacterium]|nr:hypothetical protein [Nitrospirales bacterium]